MSAKTCECGCGKPVPLAKRSRPERGYMKGEPMRYAEPGHARRLSPKQYEVNDNGCWIWQRSVNTGGYGHLGRAGTMWPAHRWYWTKYRGEIPEGMHVLHTCDVRRCVNPEHLFLGTNADNVRDKIAKGRAVNLRGQEHGMAKLSEDDVREMREKVSDGRSRKSLAEEYCVSTAHANKIISGKAWGHIK